MTESICAIAFYLQTWMYLVAPVLLYAIERISTAINERNHRVNIKKVSTMINISCQVTVIEETHPVSRTLQAIIYTGNVLALYMSKPPGFRYKSGMYLFVKCPDISSFEW